MMMTVFFELIVCLCVQLGLRVLCIHWQHTEKKGATAGRNNITFRYYTEVIIMMLDGASYDDCDYMLGVDKNCCSDKEGSSNEQLLSTDEQTR